MSYYLEPESHIRDKVKVVLDLSTYATKKALEHATGIDTSDLAAKSDFISLKLDININELVKVSTDLIDLKTKGDDLDVDKLKTVPTDLKKLSDVVSKEVYITVCNTLNTKVNSLENKMCLLEFR